MTYPSTVLSVDAAVIDGAFSQYGWVPQVRQLEIICIPPMNMLFRGGLQCTDIQVEAKDGTPPYTLMVRT